MPRPLPADETYPRWLSRPYPYPDKRNLREVAPGLYVGGIASPGSPPPGFRRWATVIDMIGNSLVTSHGYDPKTRIFAFPMDDGEPIDPSVLDTALRECKAGHFPILVHCAAGLSRSASVAYGLLRTQFGCGQKLARRRITVDPRWPLGETLASAEEWAVHNGAHPR